MSLAQRRTPLALLTFAVALATVVALLLTSGGGVIEAQGQPPPGGVAYTGNVTVGGQPAPDGLMVVGRIPSPLGDDYQSQPRATIGGTYNLLVIGPPSVLFNYRMISFHILAVEGTSTGHLGPDGLTAAELDTFLPGPGIKDGYNLTFPAIPPAPADTPVPATNTPVPVDTPTPEPTVPPTPTNTPEPTATPEPTNTPTPEPTHTPAPTSTPEPTATPAPTPLPPTPIVVTATPTVGPAATPTPESTGPGTCGQGSRPDAFVLLAGLGLIGLVWMRRRRDGSA